MAFVFKIADAVTTPIPQGVIARIGRRLGLGGQQQQQLTPQVQVTLDPLVQVGWFGPGQPLAPQAPENVQGRIWDYPVTTNIGITPKAGEGVTFSMLRALATYYDGCRVVIEACKDDITKLDFSIVPRDASKKPDKRCDAIRDFLNFPDREHGWDQWVRMAIEDMVVIDAVTVYPRKTNGGDLYSLELLDGATIKRVIDFYGRTPDAPQPAYQQVLKGLPAVDYSRDELIYFPTNVATNRMYGFSIVEQIITTINISLRRQAYFLQYYTDGSAPDNVWSTPPDWTTDQIRQFKAWWDSVLAGNTAERRGTMFVPGGTKVADMKERVLTDKSDEWLMRVICFAFGISAQPFSNQVNRATAETAKEQSEERGTGNRLKRIKGLMDRILTQSFDAADLEFRWKEEDETDPATKATIMSTKVKLGAMSIDEWRALDGEDPLPDGLGEKPIVFTAQGGVLLDSIVNPPDPPPQLAAYAGQPGDGTDPAAVDENGKPVPPKPGTPKPGADAAKRAPHSHQAANPKPAAVKKLRKTVHAALQLVGESAARNVRQPRAQKAASSNDDSDAVDADAVLLAVDFSSFSMIREEVAEMLGDAAAGSALRAMVAVGVTDDDGLFTLGSENAQAWASERAADLIGSDGEGGELEEATRGMIRDAIARAFDEGSTREELADELESDYAFSSGRAALIADTELRTAENNGYLQGAKATGIDLVKHWIITDTDCCDDCTDNGDAGYIDLDDTFPSGDDAPQAHPNCRCALGIVPADSEDDDGEETEE